MTGLLADAQPLKTIASRWADFTTTMTMAADDLLEPPETDIEIPAGTGDGAATIGDVGELGCRLYVGIAIAPHALDSGSHIVFICSAPWCILAVKSPHCTTAD